MKLEKIDKTILDNFYKLVHSQPNIRFTAAASTYKILAALKKRKFENFNENLNYSIDRLVTGLASSRAFARRGYGTLLLEILTTYNISTERLVSIAHQKFGHISKETPRDNLLGYFLLIQIILKSGNHTKSKANSQYLDKIYKLLSQLLTVKSYLEYPVSKILVKHYEIFHPYMLTDIKPETLGSDAKLSSSDLLILVLCNKKEPIRKLSSLSNIELEDLYSVLLDERFQKRPLHPVFVEVSRFIISTFPNQFENFHSKVILSTFFKRNHNELAAMGLEYTLELLKFCEESTPIKTLLSDHLVRLLVLTLRGRKALYAECTQFFKSLTEIFKTKSDEIQYTILLTLTSSPGSIAFDEDSRSTSINNLLQTSSLTVLKKYLARTINILEKKSLKDERHRIKLSCARQIGFIVRRPQITEDQTVMLATAKFLLLNSCIVEEFEEPLQAALKSSYHRVLDHIVSACSPQDRVFQFDNLVTFADEELKNKKSKWEKSSKTLWTSYMDKLRSHKKVLAKQKPSKQLHSITTLFLFYGLQIIEHDLDCLEQLDELEQSVQDVLEADPNDGSWADILTDQIIAILSATECSSWMRNLCEKVFKSLIPHISQTSIDLLSNAIETNVADEEMDCDVEPPAMNMLVDEGGEEGEDEEYLNDDQMMKLDPIFARMFKKKNDVSFNSRCLSLVKILIKKHGDKETTKMLQEKIKAHK